MPILGVVASGMSGHLWAPSSSDYQSISTATVTSGGTASITFSSIPATFTHLQIRALVKLDALRSIQCTFNSDSGSNYARHYLQGDGSSTAANGSSSQTSIPNLIYCNSSVASTFGVFITDILDYTSTSKTKTTKTLWGQDFNGSGYIALDSGLWFATPAAISTITLIPNVGNIAEFSSFALYGVK